MYEKLSSVKVCQFKNGDIILYLGVSIYDSD